MRALTIDTTGAIPVITGDTKIIQGENIATALTFKIPTYMADLTYVLKFKPYRLTPIITDPLTPLNSAVTYNLPSAVTMAAGYLEIELNAYHADGTLVKTSVIKLTVSASIDGDTISVESFIPWPQQLINTLGIKADKTYVDAQDALKADKTYVDNHDAALTAQLAEIENFKADGVLGANILNLQSYAGGTHAGGVVITNVDGKLTLNGTSTALENVVLASVNLSGLYTLYVFNPAISPDAGNYLQMVNEAMTVDLGTCLLSAINSKKALATHTGIAKLRMRIPAGVTFNNYVIKPMVSLTSYSVVEYERYGQYLADYKPRSITGTKLVGNSVDELKLLKEYVYPNPTGNLVDFTKAIDNKYYHTDGTLLTGDNTTFALPPIKLEVGKTYNATVSMFRYCFADANKVIKSSGTGVDFIALLPFTATEDQVYLYASLTNLVKDNWMLVAGALPGTYQKYNADLVNLPQKSVAKKYLADDVLALIHKSSSKFVIVDKNGNGNYTTINSALAGIADTISNIVTILVMPGIYNETIDITNRYISIVTLDKARTVIKTDSGHYDFPPMKAGGGDIYVKGLTLKATHEVPASSFVGDNRAYGLHLDYAGAGITVFEDCDIIAYQCAALGTGTRPNRKHIFKACKFELIDTGDGFNPASTKYGAVFAHSHQAVAEGYQNYEFHNCVFKSDYVNAVRLLQSFSKFKCLFVNCFVQGQNKTISITNSVDAVSVIDTDSFGNNVSALNA